MVTKAADGLYYREDQSQPYSGSARRYHDQERSQRFARRRDSAAGRLEGRFEAFLPDGTRLVTREYTHEEVTESGQPAATGLLIRSTRPSQPGSPHMPPLPLRLSKAYLGTDWRGWDLAAQGHFGAGRSSNAGGTVLSPADLPRRHHHRMHPWGISAEPMT
ncbi:MAG: hypothetical protein R3F31_15345 [Verrucomicrobiales bacterium]